MDFFDNFDSAFLGYMSDCEDLDKIVDQICAGYYNNCSLTARLTETDKNYISNAVYRKTGKIINWI